MSADGRFYALDTLPPIPNLLAPLASTVSLYDQQTGTSTLVSSSSSPSATASYDAQVSADGQFVAFVSTAPDLVPGQVRTFRPASGSSPTPSADDVFLYNRLSGTTVLVSHVPGAVNVTGDGLSYQPSISADGRFVTFASAATNLVAGQITPTVSMGIQPFVETFVYDRLTATVSLVSHNGNSSVTTAAGTSLDPVISADGNFIAFESTAFDLVPGQAGPSGGQPENVFLYDQAAGTSVLVDHVSGSATTSGDNTLTAQLPYQISVSGDGRFVVYASWDTDLVAGQVNVPTSTYSQVFLYDRLTATNVLVSHNSASGVVTGNGTIDRSNQTPVISEDGNFIAFDSSSTDLVAGQVSASGSTNVFLYNRATGTNTLVNHVAGAAAVASALPGFAPSISGDGSVIVYESATEGVAGQASGSVQDVVLYRSQTQTNQVLFQLNPTSDVAEGLGSAKISQNGDFFTYNIWSRLPDPLHFYYSNAAWIAAVPTNRATASIAGLDATSGQVWLAQSTGTSFQTSLADAWSTAVTRVNVQSADFTGDGRDDLIGMVQQTGQWFVSVSNGNGTFTTTLWDAWSPGYTWQVMTGDVNGDGKADLVGYNRQNGQVWVGLSTGTSFATALWDAWSPGYTWDLHVGDVTGDGKADLVGCAAQTGQWWVGVSTGTSLATSLWDAWSPGVTWVNINLGDVNGDGKLDIVGRDLQNGQWWVGLSTGSSFRTSLWDAWNPGVTWVDVMVGDLTGDGKADLIGRALQTGQWFAGVSTGSAFATSQWDVWNPNVTWVDVQLGDFNGDGKLDVVGRVQQSGQWWVGVSTGSALQTSLWDAWSPAASWVDVNAGRFS